MDYILQKLSERSTYAGILAIVAAVGWKVDPEQFAAASAVVIALVGLWEVFRRES